MDSIISDQLNIQETVSQGGDERTKLNENGLNKYFVNPASYKGVLNRGSCTCNPLTQQGYEATVNLLNRLKSESFDDIIQEHTHKLKKLINFPGEDKFYVFYAPSGSYLCYFPLLFSKLLYPDKEIYNILTSPEELGTGSIFATEGKYFFQLNQFDEKVTQYDPISPDLDITMKTFPARDDKGHVLNHRKKVFDLIKSNYQKYSIIANLVIGSKSGIYDDFSIVPLAPDNVLWAIDMCQMRASKNLLNELLDLNCMVMITGSKFYQAPPFCGAVLVPKNILDGISEYPEQLIKPFTRIFSKYDIPEELSELRSHFRDFKNIGLLVRWETAIEEMMVMSDLNTFTALSSISRWNQFIISRINAYSEYFELLPDQEITNRTIISFSVKGLDGKFLSDDRLKELFVALTTGTHTGFKEADKIIIGQPVKYPDRSFIRLAIGSNDLRKLISNDFDFHNDHRLIDVIAEHVKKMFW